jgi:uncharacterized lipoprotein YmbA
MMIRTLTASSAGLFVLFLLFAGCVSVKKSFPEKRNFILDVSRSGEPQSSVVGPVLRIRKLRISPRFEGKGFLYRKGDLSYESDFYNEFLVPPNSVLTEELRQWLASSGLFRHVIDSGSQLEATHVFEGTVAALYGDYRNLTLPKAILGIELFLVKDVAARSEIIFRKEYRGEVPIEGSSPEALINGWNEALQRILTSLERDLRQVDLRTIQ